MRAKQLLLLGCLGLASLQLACKANLKFSPERPIGHLPYGRLASIPIVLVGRILSNAIVGRPRHAQGDEYEILALYCVHVRVENVLKGQVMSNEVSIYYFSDWGPLGGPPRLGMVTNGGNWHVGDRVMFFLRKEAGELRTACDFSDRCAVPVFSGSHPGFEVNPGRPLGYSIIDFLLTKGYAIGDEQMIKAVFSDRPSLFSDSYTIEKLKQLSTSGAPEIRKAACESLSRWDLKCEEPRVVSHPRTESRQ